MVAIVTLGATSACTQTEAVFPSHHNANRATHGGTAAHSNNSNAASGGSHPLDVKAIRGTGISLLRPTGDPRVTANEALAAAEAWDATPDRPVENAVRLFDVTTHNFGLPPAQRPLPLPPTSKFTPYFKRDLVWVVEFFNVSVPPPLGGMGGADGATRSPVPNFGNTRGSIAILVDAMSGEAVYSKTL
jgi:hypothetical protein